MTGSQSEQQNFKSKKRRTAVRVMTVTAVMLLSIVLILPGTLRLLYRADAQVALGNAKVVRLALQAAGTECYGLDTAFSDPFSRGGVTEAVYREVLMRSKAPGDFWVLQLGDDGYTVERFLYTEDEYQVYYQNEPLQYEVYRAENYIRTRSDSGE